MTAQTNLTSKSRILPAIIQFCGRWLRVFLGLALILSLAAIFLESNYRANLGESTALNLNQGRSAVEKNEPRAQVKVDSEPKVSPEARAAEAQKVLQAMGAIQVALAGKKPLDRRFFQALEKVCHTYDVVLILDEVQSGYGRSGKFFAHQHHGIKPDIICMAKGMGNGFPIGGILVGPDIKAKYGMLGTTFGGNHLACSASLAVLEVLQEERLQEKAVALENYFRTKAKGLPHLLKIKGRGLMLGLEFDFEVADLRKELIYNHKIFTGGSSNKKLIRILPPLTIKEKHFDTFFDALIIVLKNKDTNY